MDKSYEVLIVDDEPVIRKGLQKLLEASGRRLSRIRLAANGAEAVRAMEEHLPHFVFTDIRMPDMDGIELCRLIQQRGWLLQAVVISGFGEFQYAQKCLSYGVKEYLLKPVNTEELERVLDKLIAAADAEGGHRLPASVSIRECERHMERLGQHIWHLREKELRSALSEWIAYAVSLNLPPEELAQLLKDNLSNLLKWLNSKDVYPFDVPEAWGGHDGANDLQPEAAPAAFFERSIAHMYEYLQRKRKGNAIDPIEAAKSYIESHLKEEVSLEEVADYLGLNPSYFSQLFKQTTEETFVHYRMKKRMERARWMVENASYRMSDIAQEVGYMDYSHFAKTFKKWYGVSPTEYRSRLGLE